MLVPLCAWGHHHPSPMDLRVCLVKFRHKDAQVFEFTEEPDFSGSPNNEHDKKEKLNLGIRSLEPRILLSATWAEPDVDEQAEDEEQDNEDNSNGR